MKTMLIFIAIVLAGILANPLFDAIVWLPCPTSGKYDPQGGWGWLWYCDNRIHCNSDGYLPGYGQQSFSYLQYIRQFILLKSIQIINLRKINLNCMKCLQTERLMKK